MAEHSPKEINRISGREFQNRLPASWIIRNQEDQEDFGIDFEIEPETNGQASGLLFKIQLKGTETADFTADGSHIRYSDASVARFSYYFKQLKVPVIFVVYDINTDTCAWVKVQGNKQVESVWKEAAEKNQKTFTLRLPVANAVSSEDSSISSVLNAVEEATYHVALRHITDFDPTAILQAAAQSDDPAKLEEAMKQLASHAASASLERMMQERKYDEAAEKANKILKSPSEPANARIMAGLMLVRAFMGINFELNKPQAEVLVAAITISRHMVSISRSPKCSRELRRYSLIFARKSKIHLDAHSFMALAISESGMQGNNYLSKPIVMIQRAEHAQRIMNSYSQAYQRLSRYIVDGDYQLLPYAYTYLIEALTPFLSGLRILKLKKLSDSYLDTLDKLFPMAIEIASALSSETSTPNLIHQCCFAFAMPSDLHDPKHYADRRTVIERTIEGKISPDAAEQLLNDLDEAIESANKANKMETIEDRKAAYRLMAANMGIDLESEDLIAEVVRIGIEDLDPTRVLKKCIHMHVATTSYGMPAEMLSLPTAGSKRLTCLKHGHSVEGLKLDEIYEMFAGFGPFGGGPGICCKDCEDCTPHSDDWKFSDQWQASQAQLYKERFPKQDQNDPGVD